MIFSQLLEYHIMSGNDLLYNSLHSNTSSKLQGTFHKNKRWQKNQGQKLPRRKPIPFVYCFDCTNYTYCGEGVWLCFSECSFPPLPSCFLVLRRFSLILTNYLSLSLSQQNTNKKPYAQTNKISCAFRWFILWLRVYASNPLPFVPFYALIRRQGCLGRPLCCSQKCFREG